MTITTSVSLFRFLTIIMMCSVLQCTAHSIAGQNEAASASASAELNFNKKIKDDFLLAKLEQEAENYDRGDFFREARAPKPTVEKYRKMLQGLIRKGSLYNTLPIDADLFDQYMSNYVSGNEKRFFQTRQENSRGKEKKAACGQLSGAPGSQMNKWMCW